jgi:hypothetical protein
LSHAQAIPNTIKPAMTATAIAQTLTLTSPITCRLASFSAISRLRCLSWSGELIANLRIRSLLSSLSTVRQDLQRLLTKHMPMREILPAA